MDDHPTDDVTRIRALLMEWDPIGIADEPGARDEYDCMIPTIVDLLAQGADATRIHGWITHQLVEHFGLDPVPTADRALAEGVVALRDVHDPHATYPRG